MYNSYNSTIFDFDKYPEGTPCLVRCADGVVREAYCFKHHPCGDRPDIWSESWVTNAADCQDEDGHLHGEQSVDAWEVIHNA